MLLLHGHPQTHAIWHRVAPELSRRFTLVLADLRGYGDSSKPPGDADHANYSKRVMARDMLVVMRLSASTGSMCWPTTAAPGWRTAWRPTTRIPYAGWRFSTSRRRWRCTSKRPRLSPAAYWHWFFLIQPAPLPERLIEADPAGYVRDLMGGRSAGLAPFDPRAVAEYQRCLALPGAAHGLCEDYRAGASIDLDHDRADRAAGRKLGMPVLVLWGDQGVRAPLLRAVGGVEPGRARRPRAVRCPVAITSPKRHRNGCSTRSFRSSFLETRP